MILTCGSIVKERKSQIVSVRIQMTKVARPFQV